MKILGMGLPELLIILIVFGIPIFVVIKVMHSSSKKNAELVEKGLDPNLPEPPLGVYGTQSQSYDASLGMPPAPQGEPAAEGTPVLMQPAQTQPAPQGEPVAAINPAQMQFDQSQNAQSQVFVPYVNQSITNPDWPLYQAFAEGTEAKAVEPRMLRGISSEDNPFSGFALLVGPLYFAYRKCLLELVVIMLLIIAVTLIAPESFLVDLSIWLGCGFAFYPLYRRKARKAVEQAKLEGCSEEGMRRLREKGGTSVPLIFAGVGIVLGMCVLMAAGLFLYYAVINPAAL